MNIRKGAPTWVAEHHGGQMRASVAPEVMIGAIATATEGSGSAAAA